MKKIGLSEFIASQDLDLYHKDGVPSANVAGTEAVLVKKGEAIPIIFIPLILRYNRNFISNLQYADGIPQLTKEQEEKYHVKFSIEKRPFGIPPIKYTAESLTIKANELGAENFKKWAESEFGTENIGRKKTVKAIIAEILKFEKARRIK